MQRQNPTSQFSVRLLHKPRFRQDWLILEHAAAFFFPAGTKWTSLNEVRLPDRHGRSAGNIDVVLVSYDERGRI